MWELVKCQNAGAANQEKDGGALTCQKKGLLGLVCISNKKKELCLYMPCVYQTHNSYDLLRDILDCPTNSATGS